MSAAAAVASKKRGRRGTIITNIEFTPTLPNEKVRKKDVDVEVLLNGYINVRCGKISPITFICTSEFSSCFASL
jgi:hypothetical protein